MQPMMMMPQPMMQPMMMVPQQHMMQPTMMMSSATGAKAAELIEAQLHTPTASESAAVPVSGSSMLDVAPEVKPAESSSASSESSEGKRVIKLS